MKTFRLLPFLGVALLLSAPAQAESPRDELILALPAGATLAVGSPPGDGGVQRLRHRWVGLSLLYQRQLKARVGLRVGATGAVGGSRFVHVDWSGYTAVRNRTDSIFTKSAQLELGPVLGPYGPFYLAPAAQVRGLWARQTTATFEDGNGEERVAFARMVLLPGLRMGFGVRLGVADIGWGLDFGAGAGGVNRHVGAFVRLGVALGGKSSP